MSFSSILKISPNAVFESFEDEVVVINMVSGSYFALDAIALRVWELLQQPQSLSSIVEAMQRLYRGEAAEIEAAVREFVAELEREGLLVQTEGEMPSLTPATDSAPDAELPLFRKPELSKFSDMEDLLLLDPIHEVDEAGWPHAKPADQAASE